MSHMLDCALPYAPGHLLQIDLMQERIMPRRQGRTVDVIDLVVRNMEPDKPVHALYLLYPNTLPDESFSSREYVANPASAAQREEVKDFVELRRRASRYPAGSRPWWPRRSVWRFGLIDRTIDLTKRDWVDNAIYHEMFGAEFRLGDVREEPKGWLLDGWFYVQPETVDADLVQVSELLKGSDTLKGIDLQQSRIYFGGEVRPFEQSVGIADELTDQDCQLLSKTGFSLIKVAFAPGAEIASEPRWLRLELWPTRCNYITGDSGRWASSLLKNGCFLEACQFAAAQ